MENIEQLVAIQHCHCSLRVNKLQLHVVITYKSTLVLSGYSFLNDNNIFICKLSFLLSTFTIYAHTEINFLPRQQSRLHSCSKLTLPL